MEIHIHESTKQQKKEIHIIFIIQREHYKTKRMEKIFTIEERIKRRKSLLRDNKFYPLYVLLSFSHEALLMSAW